MLDTIGGLPLHPLIVHAAVVVIPLAAVLVLGVALWPRLRRWAGPLPLGLAVLAFVLAALTTKSGEAFEPMVGHSELIEQHEHLAEGLLPWMIGLFLAAAGVTWLWWRERPRGRAGSVPRAATIGIAVLAVVAALGTGQQVLRIGHSGAEATWSDVATE